MFCLRTIFFLLDWLIPGQRLLTHLVHLLYSCKNRWIEKFCIICTYLYLSSEFKFHPEWSIEHPHLQKKSEGIGVKQIIFFFKSYPLFWTRSGKKTFFCRYLITSSHSQSVSLGSSDIESHNGWQPWVYLLILTCNRKEGGKALPVVTIRPCGIPLEQYFVNAWVLFCFPFLRCNLWITFFGGSWSSWSPRFSC